ncbi:MAG TPA: 50S ribosomal protein L21 [Armatimonadota bacterium]|jgi:large subunit ribosomal protein L21
MYAVVRTGGKQYRVGEKQTVDIEKLDAAVGDLVELGEVLMVDDAAGVRVGTPIVEGAKVTAKIVRQFRGEKINGFTYKAKKRVSRRYGHRQNLTQVLIEKIEA